MEKEKKNLKRTQEQAYSEFIDEDSSTESMVTVEPIIKESKKVVCTFPGCNKQISKSTLYHHKRRCHEFKKSCIFPGCNKTIPPYLLKEHMKTHDLKSKIFYICNDCKEEKKSYHAMQNHLKNKHTLLALWTQHYKREIRPT